MKFIGTFSGKDPIRPAMSFVQVKEGSIVATDANKLIRIIDGSTLNEDKLVCESRVCKDNNPEDQKFPNWTPIVNSFDSQFSESYDMVDLYEALMQVRNDDLKNKVSKTLRVIELKLENVTIYFNITLLLQCVKGCLLLGWKKAFISYSSAEYKAVVFTEETVQGRLSSVSLIMLMPIFGSDDFEKVTITPKVLLEQGGMMAKGGIVFYEGQSVMFPPTKNTRLNRNSKNFFNQYANKELVIGKIESGKPYDEAEAFVKSTGEKVPFTLRLNPKYYFPYEESGVMADGGRLLTTRERYILELKGLAKGLRPEAIDKFIDDNDLTNDEILNTIIGLGRKQISQSDFVTALVGKKDNVKFKNLMVFIKSDKALRMADGGEVFIPTTYLDYNPDYLVGTNTMYEMFEKGGKIGFEALSKKVAARYEGKSVKPKFQAEYGKTYSSEEASEVGDKVAAKVYRQQQAKMAKGGEIKSPYIVTFGFQEDGEYAIKKSKPIFAENENAAAIMLKDQFEAYEGLSCDIINVKKMADGGMMAKGGKIREFDDVLIISKNKLGMVEAIADNIYYVTTPFGESFEAALDDLKKVVSFAPGGSLQGHGFEVGDRIAEDLGGYIRVVSEDGKDYFIKLRDGDRLTEPPLPFKHGGKVKHSDVTRLATKTNESGDEVVDLTEFYEGGGNVPKVFDVPAQFLDAEGKRKNDRKTIKELTDFVLDLPQTKEIYYNDELGDYTPSRKKLHAEIINKFKKEVVCINNDKPIAIFMGGSPASGKSSFLRKYSPFLLKEEILKIDADEIRAMLPEYEGWNACQTHLETKDIVNILLSNKNIGIPCDFDIIYDGTMNSVKSYIPLMDILRKRGYKIFIVFMDNVPKDVIIKRALERYKTSGRFVPLEVIEDFFSKGKNAFNELKKDVDGYMLIDGSSQDYKVIEEGGMKLPRDREYSKLGTKIKASEIPVSYKKGGLGLLY
jgi:predicted ABC-type ATPase